VRFAKITLPFYGYAERLNLRFPSGFLILLDLNVFLEVKKTLQESVNHTQVKLFRPGGDL